MILSQKYNTILTSLAKRKSCINTTHWYSRRSCPLNDNYYCFICNKYISEQPEIFVYQYNEFQDLINNHGLQHLKDYNLLHLI